MENILFYLFAIVTLVSAAISVVSRNIIHAAYALFFTLFSIAGLYVLLNAEFIAVIQVVIYVGGILILLIFGVMLTTGMTAVPIKTSFTSIVTSSVLVGILGAVIANILLSTNWNSNQGNAAILLKSLGTTLINEYVLIFELFGMLLLLALIGAASIARK